MEFGETKETFLLFRGSEWRAKGDRRRGSRSCGRCRMSDFGTTRGGRTFRTAIRDDGKFIIGVLRRSKMMFHFHRLIIGIISLIKVFGIEAEVEWRGGSRRGRRAWIGRSGLRDMDARMSCVAGDVAVFGILVGVFLNCFCGGLLHVCL